MAPRDEKIKLNQGSRWCTTHNKIYLERRGSMQLLLRAFYEDGAVRKSEAYAADVGVTERLPAVRLVGDDFHGVQGRVQLLQFNGQWVSLSKRNCWTFAILELN